MARIPIAARESSSANTATGERGFRTNELTPMITGTAKIAAKVAVTVAFGAQRQSSLATMPTLFHTQETGARALLIGVTGLGEAAEDHALGTERTDRFELEHDVIVRPKLVGRQDVAGCVGNDRRL